MFGHRIAVEIGELTQRHTLGDPFAVLDGRQTQRAQHGGAVSPRRPCEASSAGRSRRGRERVPSLGTALPPLKEVLPGRVYPHRRAPYEDRGWPALAKGGPLRL
jgi:hypothetical protein